MKEFLFKYWPEIATLVIAIIALVVSIKAWRKSRAIYGIERSVIRQYTGKHDDLYKSEDILNEKLSSGNYTILAVLERTKSDSDWEVLLGRIEPYQDKPTQNNKK